MELELFKTIWEEADKKVFDTTVSGDAILRMTKRPTLNIVEHMRRNLRIEVIIILVCVTLIALLYFSAFNRQLQEISWMYILLATAFLYYYYRKNNLLKKMQCPACNVKSNLELQLHTLEKYIHLYLIGGIILVPAVLFSFYLLAYYKHIILFPFSNLSFIAGLLTYTAIVAIITTVLFFLHRWYIYKLYGRHIQRLKSMLNEMSEEH